MSDTLTKKKSTLKQELIDTILAEKTKFSMCIFHTGNEPLPTCGTARCMAGHIIALRPKRAKELRGAPLSSIAERIWEEEIGELCRLDFFAINMKESIRMAAISKKQAVAHIRGRSKVWPLLNEDK